jgi:hypothetical protein
VIKRILFALFFTAATCHAACHTVSPSGSGAATGADWNNTMANLPGTLTRGDTYYLADGVGYSASAFGTASGSTLIVVKKALASGDYGQACGVSAGFNGPTQGSGSATFSGSPALNLAGAAYILIDGQGRTTLNSGYGIVLDSSSCTNTTCYTLGLGFNGGAKASNITVQFTEFKQSNPGGSTNFNQDYGVYAYNNDNGTPAGGQLHDILLQNNYHHNSACDFIFTRGATNVTVQYSYFYNNNGGSACHGQLWEDNNSSNVTFRHNQANDIRGTSVFVVLCDICSGATIPTTGFHMYSNVVTDSVGGAGWTANGSMACLGPSISCSDMTFNNNTVANLQNTGAGAGANVAGVTVNSATASPSCENNLFYNINANVTISVGSCSTEDYNSAIFSGSLPGVFTGAHDVIDTANTNHFTSCTSSGNAPADCTLTSDAGADYGSGVSLASPYNLSCTGILCSGGASVTRGSDGTWERGWFEFVLGGGGGTPAAPPKAGVILSFLDLLDE